MLLATLCLLFASMLWAQTATREYNIKAAFLFNFTRFINWPAAAFEGATAPFIIGILGDDPFGPTIDATVKGENYQGHPMVVERYKSVKDMKPCHILFVPNQDSLDLQEILKSPTLKNTLTVGERPNFVPTGGIIRLKNENNKVKLQINPAAAKAAELSISSQLLRLAEITTTL
jgi:hypothetical protein